MYKGHFRTDTFNENNPEIQMNDWVEPTLYNNGNTDIYVNGMTLRPQGILRLGPANVEMNGTVHIRFPETGSHDVKVNYVIIEKPCP
jgi:hypothetical protein